jgi:chromodomain-helicase-DNA-binding protein 4
MVRKCCGHPYLIDGVENRKLECDEANDLFLEASSKIQLLVRMLPRLKADGHRVLIFSQFKLVLDILEDFLDIENHSYCRLDGDTPTLSRQRLIEDYNAPGSDKFCFLLTTRTGGVGINLTSADTIIIFDADWNPHMDLQAIARAYRMGQTKPVVVYKLVARKCIEERIAEIAKEKLVLDRLVVGSFDDPDKEIKQEELSGIIAYGARDLFEKTDSEIIADSKISDDLFRQYMDRDTLVRNQLEAEKAEAEVDKDADSSTFGFVKVFTFCLISRSGILRRILLAIWSQLIQGGLALRVLTILSPKGMHGHSLAVLMKLLSMKI